MEIKDISLDGKPWNTSGKGEIFSDNSIPVGKEKVEALKQAINEINELIDNREKLSKKMISEAEQIKIDISNFFVENPTGEQEVREKIALKQKQVDISELQLNEKIKSWQDIARLKQELREKEQELSEKQERLDMLKGILEE
tara:strand:+ start:582 stop:1007 length:426 start_codon:yes stop_codon:yes gene_type:complete